MHIQMCNMIKHWIMHETESNITPCVILLICATQLYKMDYVKSWTNNKTEMSMFYRVYIR